MYGCESLIIKKAVHQGFDAFDCCAAEGSWESLGLHGDQSSNPKWNPYWIFFGRTDAESEAPILWLPDGNSWLFGKHPDAGNVLKAKKKGAAENEMVK